MFLLLLLFLFLVESKRSEIDVIKDQIFLRENNMGHQYIFCAQYMNYEYTPGSGLEQSKCRIAIIKCKSLKKLRGFLDYIQVLNP